jgi:hypothetical protein
MAQLIIDAHKRRYASFCPNREGWGPFSGETYDFTPCFQATLSDAPSLLVILGGCYALVQLFKRPDAPAPRNWHFWTKLAVVAGGFVAGLVCTIVQAQLSYKWWEDVRVWSGVLTCLAVCMAGVIHFVEHGRSRVSSGLLIFYWLIKLLVDAVRFRSMLARGLPLYSHSNESFLLVPFAIELAFTLAIWVLQSLVPKANASYGEVDQDEKCPVEEANILSKLTFQWLTPIMREGYNHYLTDEDLTPLRDTDKCKQVSDNFETIWHSHKSKTKGALWKTLARLEGATYAVAALCKGAQDILAFVQPQLLRMLISFVNSYDTDKPQPKIKGFAIAIGMFLVSLLQSGFLHQYFQRAFETGMRIRSALTSSIYKKALVLSSEGRSQKTTGDIVNLMSVDTQRISDLTQYGTSFKFSVTC